jgi:hypothetical protein
MPLHPLVTPSEIGTAPSSLLPEKEALRNSLATSRFSSMTPSPLPPLPYKRHREPHNPPPHRFPALLWVSLAQELAPTRAQAITATTPHRPAASVAPHAYTASSCAS